MPECFIGTEHNEPMSVKSSFLVEILTILDPLVWITVPVMTMIDDSVGLVLCPLPSLCVTFCTDA